jgi:hypothetical protein
MKGIGNREQRGRGNSDDFSVLPLPDSLSDTLLSGRVEYDFILLKPVLRIELDGQHHLNLQQRQLDISSVQLRTRLWHRLLQFNIGL